MILTQLIALILKDYPAEKLKPFALNGLANSIRNDASLALEFITKNTDIYKIVGSPGKGNWAKVPWIAILNSNLTNTAESGYYVVILFNEDFSGFYISLNQGVTDIRKLWKSDAKSALMARANDFSARLGKMASGWLIGKIDLKCSDKNGLSSFYESGNILAKFYPFCPEENELRQDIEFLVKKYEQIFYTDIKLQQEEDDEEYYENPSQLRLHKRIERNKKLVERVKSELGYKCMGCGLEMGSAYEKCGNNYIEAHHLTPISSLGVESVKLDPKTDFAVLCPNCHRMIHRSGMVGELSRFKIECVKVSYVF